MLLDIEPEDDDGSASAEGYRVVSDTICGKSRWSIKFELIFTEPGQEEGTAWRLVYSQGATESQDEVPFQYSDATVQAKRVRLVSRAVEIYEDCETGKALQLAVWGRPGRQAKGI